MPRRPLAALVLACAALVVAAGCGKSEDQGTAPTPQIGKQGTQPKAAQQLGFPTFATRNTTRVGGADAVADAAAVAQAVFPGTADVTRPAAVTLVDANSWQDGVAASVLFSLPLRAPILLTQGGDVPGATSSALKALNPRGEPKAGNAQVLRIGAAAEPDGLKAKAIAGNNVFATAAEIDKLQSSAAGKPSSEVMITSSERPDFAMPAAGYAAKSGDPVLYTRANQLPPETVAALKRHKNPDIFILGPESVVSKAVENKLRKLGTVTRIQGPDAVTNAIAFARYTNGKFGWGVVDPGPRPGVREHQAPARRGRRLGPVGHRPVRPAAARQQPRSDPRARPALPARHPARLREGPGARRLQSRLVDRRRGRDLDGGAGADRRPPADRPGGQGLELAAAGRRDKDHHDRAAEERQGREAAQGANKTKTTQ